MARYRCTIVSRKGKPRAGNPVERLFGTINTVFLDNLSGNNKLAKNIRQLSKSHNPKDLAIWEAREFYKVLLDFINEWNTRSVKSADLSPHLLKEQSIERFGLAEQRKIKYNEHFLRDVLPSPKRPMAVLKRNKKIQVNRVNYWHQCLRTVPTTGVTADIRYDPFDLNHIYVYYKHNWLKFRSTKPQHRQFDELEVALIAEVARQELVINENAKANTRTEFAVKIENHNEPAKRRSASRSVQNVNNPIKHDIDDICEHNVNDDNESIWDLEIPDNTNGD
jgi:putative transposase